MTTAHDMSHANAGSLGLLGTGTWRWKSSTASWTFERALASGESPADAMASTAHAVLAALPGFAIAAAARWTTDAGGEDAVVHPRGTWISDAVVTATFREHPDVRALEFDLDLIVTLPGDQESSVALDDAAQLYVEREAGKIVVWLDLHVDLFARTTWGTKRDNRELAAVNASWFSNFFAALTRRTGARFVSVDSESYPNASARGLE